MKIEKIIIPDYCIKIIKDLINIEIKIKLQYLLNLNFCNCCELFNVE